jgi:hypothetical protein
MSTAANINSFTTKCLSWEGRDSIQSNKLLKVAIASGGNERTTAAIRLCISGGSFLVTGSASGSTVHPRTPASESYSHCSQCITMYYKCWVASGGRRFHRPSGARKARRSTATSLTQSDETRDAGSCTAARSERKLALVGHLRKVSRSRTSALGQGARSFTQIALPETPADATTARMKLLRGFFVEGIQYYTCAVLFIALAWGLTQILDWFPATVVTVVAIIAIPFAYSKGIEHGKCQARKQAEERIHEEDRWWRERGMKVIRRVVRDTPEAEPVDVYEPYPTQP